MKNEDNTLTCCEPSAFKKFIYDFKQYWKDFKFFAHIEKRHESNYISHAKRELRALGYDLNDEEEGPNKWIQENIFELLEVFGNQGHSGASSSYCIEMFSKLAKFEPLCPLTGEDSEWNEVGDNWYQNNRCSHVFKNGKDGAPYDLNAYIFKNQDGVCFTSRDSRKYISFPYTPNTEYVDVIETETNEEGTESKEGSGWWVTTYPGWFEAIRNKEN